jgi:hypothetical protein
MEGKIEEARNLVETLQSLLNPVSVIGNYIMFLILSIDFAVY